MMRKSCTAVFFVWLVLCYKSVADEPYQWKSVAIHGGGFVPGVIFSPVKPDVIYCRTDMAGAYRWDPVKYGWTPITDWMNRQDYKYFGIESIAPDPVDADTVYMAGGTYMQNGNGAILRSKDRGNTWRKFEIGVPMGGNSDGRSMGERLAVDPLKTSILYFGSRSNGLLRSTDFGENWNSVTGFPAKGRNGIGLSFVVFDKRGGNNVIGSKVIYVGVASNDPNSNLYRSTDGGNTWSMVPGGPTKMMPHHAILASNGIMVLAYNNNPGPNGISDGMVWKLDTANDRWTDISPLRGKYGFGGVAVAASNPNLILATTMDKWNPDEIYRSADCGKTWTSAGVAAQHDKNGVEYLCWGSPDCNDLKGSGWMGDIDIDPFNPSRAFYVTGQGVWSSKNFDAKDPKDIVWRFENNGLEETVVLDMPSSYRGVVFSVVGDIGGTRQTDLDKPSPTGMYSNPVFGNGDGIDWAGQNPDVVVRCGTGKQNGAYSTDNGLTWKPFDSQPQPQQSQPGPFGRRGGRSGGKIAVSADGATIVWTLNDMPHYSRDKGQSWTPCQGLSPRVRVTADRVDANTFYAIDNSTIYVSTDGGATFSVKAKLPGTENAAAPADRPRFPGRDRVCAVFGQKGDIWIAANEKLYRSKNAGVDVEQIKNVQQIYAVGFGKAAPGKSYPTVYLIGTANDVYGIFRSTDEGAGWLRINDDAHEFGSPDYCAGDETVFGRVYIAPHGRGILYGEPAK
jgi:photosystem II stability/assembly factor-like uncharacterized protein